MQKCAGKLKIQQEYGAMRILQGVLAENDIPFSDIIHKIIISKHRRRKIRSENIGWHKIRLGNIRSKQGIEPTICRHLIRLWNQEHTS